MALSDMIPGVAEVKLIVGGVIAAAVIGFGAYVWFEWHDYQKMKTNYAILEQNNKVLQENNDVLKGNLGTCTAANSTDNKTITDLLNERADAQTAISTLAAQTTAQKQTIGGLQSKLTQMLKDPKNDGALAPDLREAVRGIQSSGRK